MTGWKKVPRQMYARIAKLCETHVTHVEEAGPDGQLRKFFAWVEGWSDLRMAATVCPEGDVSLNAIRVAIREITGLRTQVEFARTEEGKAAAAKGKQNQQQLALPGPGAAISDGPALALRMAYCEGGMTMTAMAKEMGLSVSRVSRLIAATERETTGRVGA